MRPSEKCRKVTGFSEVSESLDVNSYSFFFLLQILSQYILRKINLYDPNY